MKPRNATERWRSAVVAMTAVALLATACSSNSTLGLEDLGLAIETDIQAGTTFEATVTPNAPTVVHVDVAPAGVTAMIAEGSGVAIVLTVAVDADTPRGAYALVLVAVRDGEEYELEWPFDVVDT